MSIKQINPYILLNGTAAKAIELYESALGAKTESIMRFGDAPGMNPPPEQKNFIMHATLRIGANVVMMSDTPPDRAVAPGGNVEIALHFTGLSELAKAFDALAAGGKVSMPPQDTFWGARFAMLTDAYGVKWMLSCELKGAEA